MLAVTATAYGQRDRHLLMNEQGTIQVRSHAGYTASPANTTPPTVATKDLPEWQLSLDEAIQLAMQNTDVVRVLSGVGAASTGQTIYSPAINNAGIDSARAEFDPTVTANNTFLRNETPSSAINPFNPAVLDDGSRVDSHDFNLDVRKRFLSGADANLGVRTNRFRSQQSPAFGLNPQSTSAVDFTLTQPLLRGRGANANSVPTVLAFIDTERSYFALKQGLQNTVQGVIQGYWDLVQARTELWVLEQQIRAAEWANDQNEGRLDVGSADIGEVAQSRASLANLRANAIAARATILNRVASLRGILGLPPGSDFTIIPTSPPIVENLKFDWDSLIQLAETSRPDIIELQLVLEADQQRILLANNQAQPSLDAFGQYRWNGVEGQVVSGDTLRSNPGDFTDWSLGINFSVPLTLRAERANLRQNELLLASDRANLRQQLLEVSHELAFTLRTLQQLQEQYEAFLLAREAAEKSLELQSEEYAAQRTTFLDFLLAVNTWAGTVISEAGAITSMNASLATLEQQTGTILETHGIRLFEERYCSIGPLGRRGKGRQFPSAMRPTTSTPRYESGDRASEEVFNLETPAPDAIRPRNTPPARPKPESGSFSTVPPTPSY